MDRLARVLSHFAFGEVSTVQSVKAAVRQAPLVGLGTWQAEKGVVGEVVSRAIDLGYRHIDCAAAYGNEKEIGEAFAKKIGKNGLKREDLYIVSKLWNTFHEEKLVLPALKQTLKDLQLDYLDLYIIHWPVSFQAGESKFPQTEKGDVAYAYVDLHATWRQMEKAVELGLTKAIGLSNFNSKQIARIISKAKIPPTCLQVEVTPYLNQEKLFKFCKSKGIQVVAYSPLGSDQRPWGLKHEPRLLDDPKLNAVAKKIGRSPAQVALRFQIQRGVCVIPKSEKTHRLKENFDITSWSLSAEEMDTLYSMNNNYRFCLPFFTNKFGERKPELDPKHPEYPFGEEF